jgi:hypothetical protein
MDVSGHILVSRYIHITEMFYKTEGVAFWDPPTPVSTKKFGLGIYTIFYPVQL